MKIGIISDTHDDVEYTNKAINIFDKNEVEAVIHAGDIISPPIVKEFKRLTDKGVEFFGVMGNNDGEKNGLKEAFQFIGGNFFDDVGKFELDGLRFGVYHGHVIKKSKKMMNSGKLDVYVYGHSHQKDPGEGEIRRGEKGTILLNPGTAHRPSETYYTIPHYFREASVLVFDTKTNNCNFINL